MEMEQVSEERTAGAEAESSGNGRTPREGNPLDRHASNDHRDKARKRKRQKEIAMHRSARTESADGLAIRIGDGFAGDTAFEQPKFAEQNGRRSSITGRLTGAPEVWSECGLTAIT
jgi:hypothetical protein